MGMKTSLQLTLSHQLTLTPRLQQAIRLLQLPILDLQQEIQQQIEANPMLDATPVEEEDLSVQGPEADELADFQWAHLYSAPSNSSNFNESDCIYVTIHGTTTTLQHHLRWQLDLTPMSDIDRVIATAIIDAINEDGFLTLSMSELHASLQSQAYPIELEEIQAVKHRIQCFEPVGCAASGLAETLLVQLQQLPESTPHLELSKKIVSENIELLGQHNYRQLQKYYQVDQATVEKVLQLIQHLNPRPGSMMTPMAAEYIIPDLTVKKINNEWHVSLNQSMLPRLSINAYYVSLIKPANNTEDNLFLKNSLQEARWFLKSLQSRQETLLKVARSIIEHQKEFLEYGEEAMKPLILSDIALAVDRHESTISRVTTQKYIHTPRGLFELKYFFSSHGFTNTGVERSSTAICALIKKLISSENCQKPLSDSKLVKLMEEQGIQIARRTIAKYREAMKIPPSNERKSIHS